MKKLVVALLVLVCLLIIMIGCLLAFKLVPIWKTTTTKQELSDIKKAANAYVIQKPAINSSALDAMTDDELSDLAGNCFSCLWISYIEIIDIFEDEFYYDKGEYKELFYELKMGNIAVYESYNTSESKETVERKIYFNGVKNFASETDFIFYGTLDRTDISNWANNKEFRISVVMDLVIESDTYGTFEFYMKLSDNDSICKINKKAVKLD